MFCPPKIFAEKKFQKKISPKFWPFSKIRDPLRLSFMAVAVPFGGTILLLILRLFQPSLAGVGAEAELGKKENKDVFSGH